MRRAGGALYALLLAATLAGCSGDEGPGPLERSDLPRLVLGAGDLPPGWEKFDGGRQSRRDAFLGRPAEATRFGRVDGWKARYRRSDPGEATGPLVVESKADLFEDPGGAEEELARQEQLLRESFGGAKLSRPAGIGDAALAATFAQGAGRFTTEFVVLTWRAENATASLLATGVAGLTVAQALELARKQQARIAAAG